LKELVREKGLEDKVIFTGDIQKPRDVFAAFDVTVVPSVLPEPFGRVVMESMAAGTPVIGSDCGGIPEQIVPGVTGLLFKPGDEKDLAKALDELLGDKTKRLRMSEEGKRHVREKFEDSVVYVRFKEVFTFDSALPEAH
jgi:glycosyltransferase involved in cell wall biosynthesis